MLITITNTTLIIIIIYKMCIWDILKYQKILEIAKILEYNKV